MNDTTEFGRRVLDQLNAGEYGAITAQFNDEMKAVLSADTLKGQWEDTKARFGSLKEVVDVKSGDADGFQMVGLLLDFESARLVLRLALKEGKIAGMFITPPATPPPAPAT